MWTVEYSFYNYPRLNKTFESYGAAKKFFYFIGRKSGVKRVELKGE